MTISNQAIIIIAALAIFLFVLYLVFYLSRRSKKAFSSFVQSRGLVVLPDEAGSDLEARLVEKLGGRICGVSFVVELCFLNGRDRLGDYTVHSLVKVN